MQPASLPIHAVLPELLARLQTNVNAVLVAPPGAGKTTQVPLALLNAPWCTGKVLVLEPRRLAARSAASHMAQLSGEKLGESIGLRARFETKISAATRIEVMTEGVFGRAILDDPELTGISAILFDEYHERSLDADFGLALALDAQAGLRPDLRILVMSATLDGARISALMPDAAMVSSEGRSFPVETRYLGRDPRRRVEEQMQEAIRLALRAETGSILCFLPGMAEIRRLDTRLQDDIRDPNIIIAPLYGAMEARAQDIAISPAPKGMRKIVLATSIAETSITIEGVRVIIDSGLARVPRFEPDSGITRLETERVSRAAADQRRGRAGRLEAGICYRLWAEPETNALPAFARPEILDADLSGLILSLAAWGVTDPAQLSWLDAPPQPAMLEAKKLLNGLEALTPEGRLTNSGAALRRLPLPPRLARMVLYGAEHGDAQTAAYIAAILSERGLGGTATNLNFRLEQFQRDKSPRAQEMRRLAEGWAREARALSATAAPQTTLDPALLLATAFPERIAKARGARGQFLLRNGRAASVEATDPLSEVPYCVVAELSGSAAQTRLLLAAPLSSAEFELAFVDFIEEKDILEFDITVRALRARRSRRLDAITLTNDPRAVILGEESARILSAGIAQIGVAHLPFSAHQKQWRARVMFLRQADLDNGSAMDWPDVSDAALEASIQEWLAPYLFKATSIATITPADLGEALAALLPYALQKELEREAPSHFTAPTGSAVMIDYECPQAPLISIRVGELYGLKTHPALAHGKRPLTLELLSPAQRPIQTTKDLPGFWAGSWHDVKIEMKGRYPRHLWSDDPTIALPTTRAKPRGT